MHESEESEEKEVRIILFDWRAFLKQASHYLNPYELKMLVYFALETLGARKVWARITLEDIEKHTGYSHPTTLKHLKNLKREKWIKTRKSVYPEAPGLFYSLGERALLVQVVIKDDTPTINGAMVTRYPAPRS